MWEFRHWIPVIKPEIYTFEGVSTLWYRRIKKVVQFRMTNQIRKLYLSRRSHDLFRLCSASSQWIFALVLLILKLDCSQRRFFLIRFHSLNNNTARLLDNDISQLMSSVYCRPGFGLHKVESKYVDIPWLTVTSLSAQGVQDSVRVLIGYSPWGNYGKLHVALNFARPQWTLITQYANTHPSRL